MKVPLPEQVFVLVERLPYPVKIAVLLVASTGARISECLAFRWSRVEWNESKLKSTRPTVVETASNNSHSQLTVLHEDGMVGAIGFEPMTSTV